MFKRCSATTILVASVALLAGLVLGAQRHAARSVALVDEANPKVDSPPTSGFARGSHDIASHSFPELFAASADALEGCDPIELDLAIARSIPGQEDLDVARYRQTVDSWAERVRLETERYLYKFDESPGDYKNSEAWFRALATRSPQRVFFLF